MACSGTGSGHARWGEVRHMASSWFGTYHIFIVLTPQGEPGADGAAGKEVPLCWACSFPMGLLLPAPCHALTLLCPFSHSLLPVCADCLDG